MLAVHHLGISQSERIVWLCEELALDYELKRSEREPVQVLEALKQQIGSDAFSAQYQQSPAPPGGAMVKRHWVVRYSQLPPASERLFTLQSWDTASKGGPDNDWSVCTTWIVSRRKLWYLADVWRRRVDYPALKENVEALAKKWGAKRVLVEDTGAGTSLVQELRSRVSGIIAIKPAGDKVSRMAVASAKFEAGQALLPQRAPWLADLEAELFVFPGSRHDDQCDSISQALLDNNNSFINVAVARRLESNHRPDSNAGAETRFMEGTAFVRPVIPGDFGREVTCRRQPFR